MSSFANLELIRSRLGDEIGTIRREAESRAALVYPSPYHVGMSSLGFQAIYRALNEVDGWACERSFLPDDLAEFRKSRTPLLSYESESPVGRFPVIAFSVAYELELTGLFECLELAG